MRSSWIIQVGPNPMTSVLIRNRTREDTNIQRRRQCKNGGRDWSDVVTAKECLEPPEAGRVKEPTPIEIQRECGPADALISAF